MSESLFRARWVTSGTIPFDPWHKETRIGVTLCGVELSLATMLSQLGEPARKCSGCLTLMRLDEKELIPA